MRSWLLVRRQSGETFTIVLAILPQTRFRAWIDPANRGGIAPALFGGDVCRGAAIAINGSFYWRRKGEARPLGLVRVGGRTLIAPSSRRYGGFLAIRNGNVAVLRRTMVERATTADDAIEATPILVWNGASDMKSDDGVRFDRVAIGETRDGSVAIVGAFGTDQRTVTLVEMGRIAIAASASEGRSLTTLLALDGGPSAHVALPGARRIYGDRGGMFLPNAICVSAR